jgi:hypothetical protein
LFSFSPEPRLKKSALMAASTVRAAGRGTLHHLARLLATAERIACARVPQLDIGAPQIDRHEMNGVGTGRVDPMAIRNAGR